MSTLSIAVLGAAGRMGSLVLQAISEAPDLTVIAAVDQGQLGPECFANADVVVDFSLPAGLAEALPHLGEAALVTGTTGLSDEQLAALRGRSELHPVLRADNFSAGVTLLGELVGAAAAALPDYDIEVVEAHHRRKVDAPSGTARFLAERAAAARSLALEQVVRHGRQGHTGTRPSSEICIHALRGGDVVGEHTVWLCGEGDRLKLGHVATSRMAFVQGALRAARWLAGRPPGWYGMRDVLQLSLGAAH